MQQHSQSAYYSVVLHDPKTAMAYVTDTIQEAAVLAADWVEAGKRAGLPWPSHWATVSAIDIPEDAYRLYEDVRVFPFPAPMHAKWAAQKARRGASSGDNQRLNDTGDSECLASLKRESDS